MIIDSINTILSKKSESIRFKLLVICLIDYLMISVGLFPRKINVIGITIEQINADSFLVLLLILTIFFTMSFAFYGIMDLLNYRIPALTEELEKVKDLNSEPKIINDSLVAKQFAEIMEQVGKNVIQLEKQFEKLGFKLFPSLNLIEIKKSQVERYRNMSKAYKIVLPFVEFFIPLIVGIFSLVIIIFKMVNS